MRTTGDTEPIVSPVVINIGGEGEIPGAINVNGEWLAEPGWRSAREGEPTLAELESQGHVFILLPEMDKLPFADASVDVIYTNHVCIDITAFLGPCPRSSEIWRVRKPGGVWYRDGVAQRAHGVLQQMHGVEQEP